MAEVLANEMVERLLAQAAQEVLETMFFVSVTEESVEETDSAPRLFVELRFRGDPPGLFRLALSQPTAQIVAGGFMGVEQDDDLSADLVRGVIRELANVICGNAVSRLESDSSFDLQAPIEIPAPGSGETLGEAHCRLLLDCGALDLWLSLQHSP